MNPYIEAWIDYFWVDWSDFRTISETNYVSKKWQNLTFSHQSFYLEFKVFWVPARDNTVYPSLSILDKRHLSIFFSGGFRGKLGLSLSNWIFIHCFNGIVCIASDPPFWKQVQYDTNLLQDQFPFKFRLYNLFWSKGNFFFIKSGSLT